MRLVVNDVLAKEIVVRSNLPKAPFVANPYTGCQFGCVYCYADFMRRWTGHSAESWGDFVDVKVNAPDLVRNHNHAGKNILFSSVTDPYQPLEAKHKITRRVLENLAIQCPQPTVGVLTKSTLVTRDLDVLRAFTRCSVGFSFSTLDDETAAAFEPRAPRPAKRLEAMAEVHGAGITTYAFVSPILPFVTDIADLVDQLLPHADSLMFENLNVRSGRWPRIQAALERVDSSLVAKCRELYADKRQGRQYWEECKARIAEICSTRNVTPEIYFHH